MRRATIDDLPAAAQLFRRSFRHTYPHFPELHTAEEDLQFFRESVFPTNEIWLAVDREKGLPVGVIAFTSETVNHLYLLPEVQHRGIGSALLDIAKSHGKPLRLWTFQCNEVAKKFYAKHGFHVIKETDGAENEEGQPDLLFEWLP